MFGDVTAYYTTFTEHNGWTNDETGALKLDSKEHAEEYVQQEGLGSDLEIVELPSQE